tara:strand:+ start:980 stop:1363 length:384 start_codon:yes stop_codon:yes gene_type:complete
MNLIKILFLIIPFTMIAQKNCSKLTEGKFRPEFGPYMSDYEIIRTDSTQIDIDRILGVESKFKIVWLSDCEYKLKRISGKGYGEINDIEIKYLIFKIDTVDNNRFRYLVINPEDGNLIDTTTLVKIK